MKIEHEYCAGNEGASTSSILHCPPSQAIWVDAEAYYRMKFRLEVVEAELAQLKPPVEKKTALQNAQSTAEAVLRDMKNAIKFTPDIAG